MHQSVSNFRFAAPNPPKCVELVPEPGKSQNLILKFQEPNGSTPELYELSIFEGEIAVEKDIRIKQLRYIVEGLQPNTEYFATVRSYSLNKDCPSKEARSSPVKTCKFSDYILIDVIICIHIHIHIHIHRSTFSIKKAK